MIIVRNSGGKVIPYKIDDRQEVDLWQVPMVKWRMN